MTVAELIAQLSRFKPDAIVDVYYRGSVQIETVEYEPTCEVGTRVSIVTEYYRDSWEEP